MTSGETLLQFIGYLFYLMGWLIIARALLSWFPNARGNMIVEVIHQITDPVMIPLQRLIPRIGMIDISPMIAVIVFFTIANALGAGGGGLFG